VFTCEHLEQDAARDQQARTEQERLRIGYLAWREHEARRRKHDIPLHARLAQGRAAVLALIDGEQLGVCPSCGEIAYPAEPVSDPRRYAEWRPRREPARCHFCGAYNLDGWDERHVSGLLYGGAYRPSDLDLRSAGGSDLLDRERPFGDEQEERWS
jgi:hypothetical protein